MTSLYDQYHSKKNTEHIYNLINDLIKKNNNDISIDSDFKQYYTEKMRELFITSKADNLSDLNRELIKHHIMYYKNNYTDKNNHTNEKKSIPLKSKVDLDNNNDVKISFDNYLKDRDLTSVKSIKKNVKFNDIPNIKPIDKLSDDKLSFDDMMNNVNKPIIKQVIEPVVEPVAKQVIEHVVEPAKNYITITSANRTDIDSSRFHYNIKSDSNIKGLERLILPIENTLHFAQPVLKFKIPEMNIDTNLYLHKTYKLNNYTYGVYLPNDDLVLNKINDNINIEICSIYGDVDIENDIIECELIEEKLKPKNINHFKKDDIISINSKHFTKIIDIVEDTLILEKMPIFELEEKIYIMNMNLQNTLVFY
jgi:hypothetical protein